MTKVCLWARSLSTIALIIASNITIIVIDIVIACIFLRSVNQNHLHHCSGGPQCHGSLLATKLRLADHDCRWNWFNLLRNVSSWFCATQHVPSTYWLWVQAAVRAMDTIAAFTKQLNPSVDINKFLVCGESKVILFSLCPPLLFLPHPLLPVSLSLIPTYPHLTHYDISLLYSFLQTYTKNHTCTCYSVAFAARVDNLDNGGSGQAGGGHCSHGHGPPELSAGTNLNK